MNKCIIIGNLTRDPESNTSANGITYTRFSVAVNRTFTNANGEREVDFFPVTTWRGLAENCAKFLFKGSKVCVSGPIQIRSYDDKDGVKRTAFEISADDVEFLSPKGEGSSYTAPTASTTTPKQNKKQVADLEPVENEDLPF